MSRAKFIEDYWYSIDWDVKAIWRLDLPVEPFPIGRLLWHFDVPLWPFAGEGYAITPRQVLSDPAIYHIEHERMLAADMAFPIDIVWHRNRWMILDGVHRLLKAHRDGAESVAVRRVPRRLIR